MFIHMINLISILIFRANSANQKLLSSESAEDIASNGEQPSTPSPRIRNRYLKKVGVADADINDDCPLLDDAE